MQVAVGGGDAKTQRHWRVLRNALLSKSRDVTTDTTDSSLATEFFPVFASRRVQNDATLHHPAADNFEWVVHDLAMPRAATPGKSVIKQVLVHEKQKHQKLSLVELFSHKVNQGVDNTGNIRTWPSEPVLLSYLLKTRQCQVLAEAKKARINCCELGSGMAGVSSLGLLAHYGEYLDRLLITDGNPLCVENLRLCLDENQSRGVFATTTPPHVKTDLLRWDRSATFDTHLRHQFDLLVASDCLFFEEFHVDLAHTIKQLLRPDTGRCFLMQPSRNGSMERFCAIAEQQFGLHVLISRDYDDAIAQQHTEYLCTRADYVADVHFPVLLTVRAPSMPPDLSAL
ncbi:hypothetical protein Poli38472_009219 [Pythium oligandrum]|uniref:Calmodulin-lysine N-methyltransferase n=1 Tax=Pythium oligandrum TaxID=41045 RepID=A0A8K1CMG4_PYTOL|nr:hypothetical protein Poli38472_009219 [Pythium oligandrum]|eukprot:TMW65052.1 hypothetical protein Poli38472_009219 [Pythium oligandrum]